MYLNGLAPPSRPRLHQDLNVGTFLRLAIGDVCRVGLATTSMVLLTLKWFFVVVFFDSV